MRVEDVDLLALIQGDVHLTRTSPSYRGGQWSGKCPFSDCGSQKDGFQVWPYHDSGRGRFWCRKCGLSGDAISYVREMDGLGFLEACAALKVKVNGRQTRKPPPAPSAVQPPPILWQERGLSFISYAEEKMWAFPENPGRVYLHEGGLTDETIKGARVGWNPRNVFAPSSHWGLTGDTKIACNRGVVFPQFAYNILWGIKIRLIPPKEHMKYSGPRGSITCLNGMDDMRDGFPALLTEGDRDRLLALQELGAVVDPVTCGGSQKTIPQQAIAALLHCPALMIATDGDLAGKLAKEKALAQVAYRANPLPVPLGYDLTSLHQGGHDLKTWFVNSLGALVGAEDERTLDASIEALVERLNSLKEEGK